MMFRMLEVGSRMARTISLVPTETVSRSMDSSSVMSPYRPLPIPILPAALASFFCSLFAFTNCDEESDTRDSSGTGFGMASMMPVSLYGLGGLAAGGLASAGRLPDTTMALNTFPEEDCMATDARSRSCSCVSPRNLLLEDGLPKDAKDPMGVLD